MDILVRKPPVCKKTPRSICRSRLSSTWALSWMMSLVRKPPVRFADSSNYGGFSYKGIHWCCRWSPTGAPSKQQTQAVASNNIALPVACVYRPVVELTLASGVTEQLWEIEDEFKLWESKRRHGAHELDDLGHQGACPAILYSAKMTLLSTVLSVFWNFEVFH